MHPEPRGQTVVSTSTRTKPQCSHAISGRGKELKWGDLSATVDNTKEARIYQICVYFSSDINIYASCPRLHKSSKSFELRSSGLLPPAGLCDKNISEQNTFYGGSLLSVADKKKLNEMWMSRNVFNNNWLLLVSEHRKCFVGNFGGSNDWAQVDRWQPLNGIFFLLPMKYFSRVILGNHQSSDLCTLSLPRSTNIWSSQMFRDSQHMRQFKQFFVTLLLKIVVFLSAGYFFITLEFCVRVTLW